jgi:hypothetical protein
MYGRPVHREILSNLLALAAITCHQYRLTTLPQTPVLGGLEGLQ